MKQATATAFQTQSKPDFITAKEVTRYARVAMKAGVYEKRRKQLSDDLKVRLKGGAEISENSPVGLKIEEYAGVAPWQLAFVNLAQMAYPESWKEMVEAVEGLRGTNERLKVVPRV